MTKQGDEKRARRGSNRLLGRTRAAAILGAAALTGTGGLLFGAGFQDGASKPSESEKIESMREAQQRFIELRTQISKERAQLAETKQFLGDRTDLLETEIAALRRAIEEQAKKADTSGERLTKLKAEKAALRDGTASLEGEIAGLEARVLELLPRLPAPVKETVSQLALGIPGNESAKSDAQKAAEAAAADAVGDQPVNEAAKAQAGAPDLYTRFIQVVGVMNSADKFNTDTHVKTETHSLPSGKAEVAVLYLGLSQAFFAKAPSEDGKSPAFAARGVPTEEGFDWKPVTESAQEILRAIAIYGGSEQAAFVNLPTVIDSATGGAR